MAQILKLAGDLWKSDNDHSGMISKEEMRRLGSNPEVLEHLSSLGLPKGFTFDELFGMLNIDGEGDIEYREFVDGMHRIIFATEFHRTCMTQLSMGQLKQAQHQLAALQETYLQTQFEVLRSDLRGMVVELLGEMERGISAESVSRAQSGAEQQDFKNGWLAAKMTSNRVGPEADVFKYGRLSTRSEENHADPSDLDLDHLAMAMVVDERSPLPAPTQVLRLDHQTVAASPSTASYASPGRRFALPESMRCTEVARLLPCLSAALPSETPAHICAEVVTEVEAYSQISMTRSVVGSHQH